MNEQEQKLDLALVAIGIYLLALLAVLGTNPWLVPGFYENVTSYEAAKSLLGGDGYRVNGELLSGPPAHATLLTLVFAIAGPSVVMAKALSLISALVALCLAGRLILRERREAGALAVMVLALMPVSLLLATRISPDWIYAALAFGFLLAVSKMRSRRSAGFALMAGVLLGAASLTRYSGVLLGVALIASGIAAWRRERRVGAIAPELIAAATGFIICALWLAHVLTQGLADAASLIGQVVPPKPASQWERLWSSWEGGVASVGLGATAASWLAAFVVTAIVIGVGSRVRQRTWAPSDGFVIVSLCALAIDDWKAGRYLIPIAPFLLCYLFDGMRIIGSRFWGRAYPVLQRSAIAVWVGVLLAFCANILFRGGTTDHGPLSPLVSMSGGHFYEREQADLYYAGEFVRKRGGGVIAMEGKWGHYALPWFDATRIVEPGAENHWDYRIVAVGEPVSTGCEVLFRNTGYVVCVRPESPVFAKGGRR